MIPADDDPRFMAAALALSERGRGRTAPNPNVGCVVVREGRVIGRGWTRPGGRPHAEAVALAEAGDVTGAVVHVTLEPCAHESERGPACAVTLAAARPAKVIVGVGDPDPRTNGRGIALLRAGGVVVVENAAPAAARSAMAGFFAWRTLGRPHVTLKLATSLDGRIALPSGESRWITGPEARAHAHLERARVEAILVGRGTLEADAPKLGVRLAGLEDRAPCRLVLSSRTAKGEAGDVTSGGPLDCARGERGANYVRTPEAIRDLQGVDHLLVEGGAATAAAFLKAGLVDRLLLYRAPILLGEGRPALDAIGLGALAEAHGRWRLTDARTLGRDRLEVYAAA